MRHHAGDVVVLTIAAGIFAAQQLAISFLSVDGEAGVLRRVIFFGTTVVLVLLALYFRRFIGAWLVAAGILMNLVPMAAHGGAMPIDYAILERSGAFPDVTEADIGSQTNHGKDIVLRREDIRFFALSDRFVVDLPLYGTNIYSAGDFVLFAGVGLILVQAVAEALRARSRTEPAGLPRTERPG